MAKIVTQNEKAEAQRAVDQEYDSNIIKELR